MYYLAAVFVLADVYVSCIMYPDPCKGWPGVGEGVSTVTVAPEMAITIGQENKLLYGQQLHGATSFLTVLYSLMVLASDCFVVLCWVTLMFILM